MSVIKEDSTVTLAYEGRLDTGDVFKYVGVDAPLTVKLGNQELPPTLEEALLGMSAGQTKTVRLSPDEGYGARQKLLVQTLSRESFGKIDPKPGMILSFKAERDGQTHEVPATVMEVHEESVVIDYNHPLAGHHLTYRVSILKVE